MKTITVRHRTGKAPFPPFSSRNFRDLSGGLVSAVTPPDGFADTEVPVSGASLAESVYLSGLFAPPALCSGIGRCGLCRVRFLGEPPPVLEAETRALSGHDLDAGWRLACRHAPVAGAHILVPAMVTERTAERTAESATGPALDGRFGLAVDFGTTSVHWWVVALDGENLTDLPGGIMTNPQMGAGSDVISRLAYAAREGGTRTLAHLASEALVEVVRLCRVAGYAVEEACIAANSALTAILLETETTTLARAPYILPIAGNTTERVGNLPPVYIPPLIAPFVGGDVSAGYAALALDPDAAPPEFPFLLADMGTNGECVLALSPDRALAASLPLGPALEGVNLAFGCAASDGAVTGYSLTPYGLEPVVMGGSAPVGITATGYLSLLRILRASNIIGEDGLFVNREGGEGEPGIRLPGKMVLYASDVEEILKVKASFTLAVSRLLREAALLPRDLSGMYLAGSLGANVSLTALSSLGFLSPGMKVTLAGNTSLAGAALFLRNTSVRNACAEWARSVKTINLASDPDFAGSFARHMAFAWRA